eukprot:759075-Hanusia_phi.AAC.1
MMARRMAKLPHPAASSSHPQASCRIREGVLPPPTTTPPPSPPPPPATFLGETEGLDGEVERLLPLVPLSLRCNS